MAQRTALKKQKVGDHGDQNLCCDFLLGSVAAVERVWSIDKYLKSDHRFKVTTHLLQAVLFLGMNKGYWDQSLVWEAMKSHRGGGTKALMHDDEELDDLSCNHFLTV